MSAKIVLIGYQEIKFAELQKELIKTIEDSGKTFFAIAHELQIKSISTIKNALEKEDQIVSDKVLTGIMSSIEFDGCVLWVDGQRNYFVKRIK